MSVDGCNVGGGLDDGTGLYGPSNGAGLYGNTGGLGEHGDGVLGGPSSIGGESALLNGGG